MPRKSRRRFKFYGKSEPSPLEVAQARREARELRRAVAADVVNGMSHGAIEAARGLAAGSVRRMRREPSFQSLVVRYIDAQTDAFPEVRRRRAAREGSYER